jgi:DDE_Tnp_1-associated/Transposase DDE domain
MSVAPGLSLQEVFAALPDPRDRRGLRHPLGALLCLTAVATLAGMRGLEAIAQFARDHGLAFRLALGFTRLDSPCKGALSVLFRKLDINAYEQALARWVLARCPELGAAIALDGKTLRGSARHGAPGVHLLAAYAPKVAAVLGQLRVEGKTNEHNAALQLLGILPLEGKVVTGDALFCQKDVCEQVLERGGDYVFTVKDNQPQLHFDIACMFAEAANFSPLPAAALGVGAGLLHNDEQGTRPAGKAHAADHARLAGVLGGVARDRASVSAPPGATVAGQGRRGDGVRDQQPAGGGSRRAPVAGVDTWPLGDREPSARGA